MTVMTRTGAVLSVLFLLALVVGTVFGARYAMSQTPTAPPVCGAHGGASLCYTYAS